jgi:hypothetical protein
VDEVREVWLACSCIVGITLSPYQRSVLFLSLSQTLCLIRQRNLKSAQDGTEKAQKVFLSIPTEVGQTEAEEIGKPDKF